MQRACLATRSRECPTVSIRADRDEAAGRSCRVDRISGPEGRVFEIVGDKHLLRNCAVRTTEAVCAAIGPRGLRLMTSSYFGVSCTRFPARRGIPQLLSGRSGSIKLFRAGPLFTAA